MSARRTFEQRRRRGYTVVELLMALGIFAIGATGILAMQLIASHSNTHAKRLAVATQLAKSWQEKLAMDGLVWGGVQEYPITNTTWLQRVDTLNGQWFLPDTDEVGAAARFGPAADANGAFVDAASAEMVFCTHVRLTQLLTPDNSQLLRSEVRVFWPKGDVAWSNGDPYCTASAGIGSIGAATAQFNFVYHTTAIRQTPNF